MNLRELQETFLTSVLSGDYQSCGVLLSPLDETAPPTNWIKKGPPLNPVDRLDIYAYAHVARIAEMLRDDFGAVFSLIGEESFFRLTTEYIRHMPPRSPNPADVGLRFSKFIFDHAKYPSDAITADRGLISEIATLEWAMVECHYHASNRDWASEADGSKPLSILTNPTLKLFAQEWNAPNLVEAFVANPIGQLPGSRLARSHAMIWRANSKINVHSISSRQIEVLRCLASSEDIEELSKKIEALAIRDIQDWSIETWFHDWAASGVMRLAGAEISGELFEATRG